MMRLLGRLREGLCLLRSSQVEVAFVSGSCAFRLA